jgi:hypothetical protein
MYLHQRIILLRYSLLKCEGTDVADSELDELQETPVHRQTRSRTRAGKQRLVEEPEEEEEDEQGEDGGDGEDDGEDERDSDIK